MDYKKNLNTLGITLVELLVAATIASLIGLAVVNYYIIQNKSFIAQQAKIESQKNAALVLSRLETDIKEAVRVEESAIPQNNALIPSDSVLILKVPAIDANSEVLYDVSGQIVAFDYIIFENAINNEVKKYIYPDASSNRTEETKVIGTDITTLLFTYYPSGPSITQTNSVGISIASTKKSYTSNIEERIIKFRNK